MPIPKQMQAVVYRGRDDLRLETVPVPEIQRGELLVQVKVCGVCPTDIKKIHYGTVPPPRILGHETAGVIVKTGAGVKGFRVGDRVALHHHFPCMDCHFCRHGAFSQCAGYMRTGVTAGFVPAGGGYAEYVRVMPFVLPGVVKIPARNSFIEGAMLEPVNTVLKAVNRLALLSGDSVLVIGQGPIGLMFTRLLKLRGMKVLATDLLANRLRFAKQWGAEAAFRGDDPQLKAKIDKALQLVGTPRRGVRAGQKSRSTRHSEPAVQNPRPILDAVVVAVPSQEAVSQAFELVRGSGKVLLFAHTKRPGTHSLPVDDGRARLQPSRSGQEPKAAPPGDRVDFSEICVDEKDLIGSYSSDLTLQEEVASVVFSRKMDVRSLVSHQFPLAETAKAVALASSPSAGAFKVVVCQ